MKTVTRTKAERHIDRKLRAAIQQMSHAQRMALLVQAMEAQQPGYLEQLFTDRGLLA